MLVRPLYCFFTIFIFYSVYMPTEPLAAHTHRGHLFSGTAGYRKHSSSTRSSWGARETE